MYKATVSYSLRKRETIIKRKLNKFRLIFNFSLEFPTKLATTAIKYTDAKPCAAYMKARGDTPSSRDARVQIPFIRLRGSNL